MQKERLGLMEKDNRVELLAPAGSPAAFYGAVNAGADAVYLGGDRFGARAYAENFTQEELVACIQYGRLFGVKVYLTVNTLIKEKELKELTDYIAPFYQAGLDAVIVQDMGVLRVIRNNFPELAIHASTQMTICNIHGTRLLKEMGAKRIVPARELSLKELTDIKKQVDIELETFIHGAMCYCYSGQCLFSSILGGRSGNRGRCAQPCRLPYGVRFEGISEDLKDILVDFKDITGEFRRSRTTGGRRDAFYPLSLKDMCTIEHIPALIEAGIDSFKIEGRMKKPEYAAGVTAIYRKYIEYYYKLRNELGVRGAHKTYRVESEDIQMLSSLYIRSQVQDGYYFRQNGQEMITLDNPAYSGTDEAVLGGIRKKYLLDRKKLDVEIEAEFVTGQPAKVILRQGCAAGEAEGETVQTALKQPITEENLRKQLSKLGDTHFNAKKMRLKVSNDAFYPLKQINELRRTAAQALEQSILFRKCNRPDQSTDAALAKLNRPNESMLVSARFYDEDNHFCYDKGWAISVRALQQIKELVTFQAEAPDIALRRVYVDGDLLIRSRKEVLQFCRHLKNNCSCQILIALPYVLRMGDEMYLAELTEQTKAGSLDGLFDGFLIRSFDGIGFFMDGKKHGILRGDACLYTWNRQAVLQLSELLDGFCIPYELNASEQACLLKQHFPWEKIVYARIPMMVTANCVLKTTEGCVRGNDGCIQLIDRYNKCFPVLRNCMHCTNIIYNSVPFSLHSEVLSLRSICDLRLDFTIETADETRAVLNTFLRSREFTEQYTTGHERRGVE